MHDDAIVYFDLTSEQFYDMCVAEYNLYAKRFKNKKQEQQLNSLNTAMYGAVFHMNPKANEIYNDFYDNIMQKPQESVEESQDRLMDCINRALELGIKIPLKF